MEGEIPDNQQAVLANDESFSYTPEVIETYTESETEQALDFIKDNELPMSDLLYALKYVRISNRAVELDDKYKEIEQRLKNLREKGRNVVSPPKCGDIYVDMLHDPKKS